MRRTMIQVFAFAALVAAPGLRALAEEPPVKVRLIEDEFMDRRVLEYDPGYKDYIEKKRQVRQKIIQDQVAERAKIDAKRQEMDAQRAKLMEPKQASVNVDEETIQVTEPVSVEAVLKRQSVRDLYEKTPEDFDMLVHDRWSLNKSDFRVDEPRYIIVDRTATTTRKYWGFTFSITNSTTAPRRIAPVFVAVTNKGAFSYEVGGFVPQRLAADATLRPLAGSDTAADKKLLAEKVAPLESPASLATNALSLEGALKLATGPESSATFQPGQTRWGVALWPEFNEDFTELKVVVHGLTNAHKYDSKLRRVLVLTFTRNDDEYDNARTAMKYQGKEFQYLWMFEQDITVPIPADAKDPQIKDKVLTTPSGAQRLLWSFPYQVANSTPMKQELTFRAIRAVLPVAETGKATQGIEVDVGGQKVAVEVQVVDDGRSNIYKAQYLRDLGRFDPVRDTNRFAPDAEKAKEPGGMVWALEPGKSISGLAVFDSADVDWEHVRNQVEDQLSMALDKKAQSAQAWQALVAKDAKLAKVPPWPLLKPRRTLTDDVVTLKDGRSFGGEVTRADEQVVLITTAKLGRLEFERGAVDKIEKGEMAKVREQVLAALPGAIEAARKKKEVVAVFDCEAGLSSGQCRVARSYRQPGVIDESWVKAWEELGK